MYVEDIYETKPFGMSPELLKETLITLWLLNQLWIYTMTQSSSQFFSVLSTVASSQDTYFNEAFDKQNSPVYQVNNPNSSITYFCRWKEVWVSIGQKRDFKIGFSLSSHLI